MKDGLCSLPLLDQRGERYSDLQFDYYRDLSEQAGHSFRPSEFDPPPTLVDDCLQLEHLEEVIQYADETIWDAEATIERAEAAIKEAKASIVEAQRSRVNASAKVQQLVEKWPQLHATHYKALAAAYAGERPARLLPADRREHQLTAHEGGMVV